MAWQGSLSLLSFFPNLLSSSWLPPLLIFCQDFLLSHQAENELTSLPVVRYGSGHRKRRLKKSLSKSKERAWDPGGVGAIRQLDKIWTKYTDKPAAKALRDPAIDEKRVLFTCEVDRIVTFGNPSGRAVGV
jgi:hypothetical protein